VTDRFERVYDVLCRDLKCRRSRRAPDIRLVFSPAQTAPLIETGDGLTITLPSLRLLEFHEPDGPADDVVTALAYQALLEPIIRQASGSARRWQINTNGMVILQGIQAWEQLRIQLASTTPPDQLSISAPGKLWPGASQGEPAATQQFYRDLLADTQLLPLTRLWTLPPDYRQTGGAGDVIDGEIDALIAFIEERYGNAAVIKLLNALGPARWLDQAIETALNVPYAEFDQQWQTWIDQ
jgi:hypothetical protein